VREAIKGASYIEWRGTVLVPLASVEFAPTAGVTIPQFDEIDRAVEFVLPITRLYSALPLINLDE